jgi:hypothetical protein
MSESSPGHFEMYSFLIHLFVSMWLILLRSLEWILSKCVKQFAFFMSRLSTQRKSVLEWFLRSDFRDKHLLCLLYLATIVLLLIGFWLVQLKVALMFNSAEHVNDMIASQFLLCRECSF